MPEIGECYSIADRIPKLGKLKSSEASKRFGKYINKKNNIVKILKDIVFDKPFAYGKSVWFPIKTKDKKGFIVSQLGMSGSWFLGQNGRPPKNDHLTLHFKDTLLRYSDPRMFGKMNLFLYDLDTKEDIFKETLKNYNWGQDPHLLSLEELHEMLVKKWGKSTKIIKVLMMDQNVVFGIGNYLASEILWKAKINPHTPGNKITKSQYEEVAKAIKETVSLAIKTGGYSFAGGYYHPDGSMGKMNKYIKAYDHAGEVCSSCHKNLIVKEEIGGRSTYWCKFCQK